MKVFQHLWTGSISEHHCNRPFPGYPRRYSQLLNKYLARQKVSDQHEVRPLLDLTIIETERTSAPPCYRRGVIQLIQSTGSKSLTRLGPTDTPGAGNYHIDILASSAPPSSNSIGTNVGDKTQANSAGTAAHQASGGVAANGGESGASGAQPAVAARIWMLDSMRRGCGHWWPWFSWGCMPEETLDWLDHVSRALVRVPSLAFIHIPIPGALQQPGSLHVACHVCWRFAFFLSFYLCSPVTSCCRKR